jgi:hypothetical protein
MASDHAWQIRESYRLIEQSRRSTSISRGGIARSRALIAESLQIINAVHPDTKLGKIKTPDPPLTTTRTPNGRYARHMKMHLFQSTRELDVFGFTSDETGDNLPADLAPWTRSGEGCAVGTGPDIVTLVDGGSSDPVVFALEHGGFYVARSETISRRTGIPWVN